MENKNNPDDAYILKEALQQVIDRGHCSGQSLKTLCEVRLSGQPVCNTFQQAYGYPAHTH